jgi:iron complex transport system substrate-binding protein
VLAGLALGGPPQLAVEPSEAPRIVSLAPHLTELAYEAGIGETLVGAVAWSDHPDAARRLPRIGDAFRFDPERILALDATHALAWSGGTPAAAIDQIAALGIEVVEIETRTLDQIGTALETLARLGDRPQAGKRAAERYRSALDARRSRQNEPAATLRVFYQVSARPLFTLGGRHVINEVFALCGATNAFAGLDVEAAAVGAEAVVAAAPDLVLVGLGPADGDVDAQSRALEAVDPALRTARCLPVHGIEAASLVRPTPRILEAADRLCERLDEIRSAGDPACGSDRD